MGMKNDEGLSKGFTYSTFLYLSYYYERVILVITYTQKCTVVREKGEGGGGADRETGTARIKERTRASTKAR